MRSLSRILALASQLWPLYVAVVTGAVLNAATGLGVPFVIKAATDEVVAALTGTGGSVTTVVWLAVGLLGLDIAHTVIGNLGGYAGDLMAVRLRSILSRRYFEKLLRLPQDYFDNQLTGTIISRLQRSITETTTFLNSFANNFLPLLITVGAALVIIASYSPWLALLLVAIYPVFTWLTMLTSRRWQVLEGQKNTAFDIAGGRFAEVVGQIRVVKSFGSQQRELDHFTGQYDTTVAITRVQSAFWHRMDVLRGIALNVIFFGIYVIIFTTTVQGAFTIGVMVLLIQLVTMARAPVTMMSYLVDSAQRAITGSTDYLAVMDEVEEPSPPADAGAIVPGQAAVPAQSAVRAQAGQPLLEFRQASFGYGTGEDVLREVSFTVARGERVALVGESGGGKTTLTSLLLGLYPLRAGTLLVDGRDIADLPVESLRSLVGIVFQDPSLFSGTIRENLAYGRPDAGEAEIIDAARRAHAHGFIIGLPGGYDAEIGERGVKLSGGQKQRIAIARALLKDAPILVLDEATSSLDSKAERLVQEGLDELMSDRTTLIIAHRLATIAGVDRIVTLADGRVDEIGTPAELATTGGIYAELLALQGSRAGRKSLRRFEIVG
ncbi:MAG: ABC transporter ATP-binding protein [Propionicimonas sp.]